MIFSVVMQSLEIRLGSNFAKTPKIYADTECVAAIAMLARLYGLEKPQAREALSDMQRELKEKTAGLPASESMEKLEEMLYAYEPKSPMDSEKQELLAYVYEHTKENPGLSRR